MKESGEFLNSCDILIIFTCTRSTLHITLENISLLPIDFVHLAFEDSTVEPAQRMLAESELSVFDTYETEYSLINEPVFSWSKDEVQKIESGQILGLSISCLGKAGWYVFEYFVVYCRSLTSIKHWWDGSCFIFLCAPCRPCTTFGILLHTPVIVSYHGHSLFNASMPKHGPCSLPLIS